MSSQCYLVLHNLRFFLAESTQLFVEMVMFVNVWLIFPCHIFFEWCFLYENHQDYNVILLSNEQEKIQEIIQL